MDFFLFVSAIGKRPATKVKEEENDGAAQGSCEGIISFRSQITAGVNKKKKKR
jgi:hypothetical protein